MARIQFGNTWWGQKWLEALNNIDFSNRLPRGQRYARNGSVLSIKITGNTVTATVAGTRPTPYRITLTIPPFTKNETKKIVAIISNNPYYMSQLGGRNLPPELHDELAGEKIILFPRSWKKMGMRCSCPDWAVPCKHLAAVVYIIANEIDKNPFLVFSIHNFNLVKELNLSVGRKTDQEIITLDSLTSEHPELYNYDQNILEAIDFTETPEMLTTISKLLLERPLFYPDGDFKKILYSHYKKMAASIKKQVVETDISETLPKVLYDSLAIKLNKRDTSVKGVLKNKNTHLTFHTGAMEEFIAYLQVLTINDLTTYPPVLAFLAVTHSFTLMLIEKSGYIPDIISPRENTYNIRWIPALFNSEIQSIFHKISHVMPKNIVTYGKAFLSKKEQLLFIISLLITHYVEQFKPVPEMLQDDVVALFFGNKAYISTKFQQQENAKTINLWLGRFFIHPKNCTPIVKIDETDQKDSISFELYIEDSRKDSTENITKFIASDNDEKFSVLRDLNLLSSYLPMVNEVLIKQTSVRVSSNEFASLWFDTLPILHSLGIKTIFPKSLQEVFIPKLTLTAKQVGGNDQNIKSYLQLKSLLDFNWSVAFGDSTLAPEEFLKLVDTYSGLVRFKDKYIMLEAKDIERITRQLKKKPALSSIDILKVHLEGSFHDVPINTEPFLKEILHNLFTPKDVELPLGLNAKLRPYQLSGFTWLYHNYCIGIGSIIADDMGLGKTIQIITFILKLQETGNLNLKKILIIVPASILLNWQRETKQFAPSLTTHIYHGQNRDWEEVIETNPDIVFTTYSLIRIDSALFTKKKWRCVITDEAQNIKNAETNQSKAVKSIKADHKIAMTGTPVENRLMDYWSITDFTMKNLLGNKAAFKKSFAIPIEKFNDKRRLEVFRNITAPFMLRRMKTDKSIISDLPDKIEMDQWGQLSKEQTALYQNLVTSIETTIETADGINRKGIIFKLIMGLKQICNHPSLYLKTENFDQNLSGKSLLLMDLLQKINDRNEKVLIFTQFKKMGALLEKMIASQFGCTPLFFHGSLQQKKRNDIVDSFQHDAESRFLIISLKAGGTGLNLTAANNVIHYDLWWNPAVENQATDRAFRIGQKKDVNVYRLITKGTFEEKINDMIANKKELADLAVKQGETWITEMSNKELKELMQLSE